jgi:hypothetical protein
MEHTLELQFMGQKIWISRLTSKNPTLIEYRFTYPDGIKRYMTMEEIKASSFEPISSSIETLLTTAIDECELIFHDNQLYFPNPQLN